VGGLYVRRADIEREVRSVIPSLIKEVEERIAPTDGGRLARGIWPLPVFRPRLQFQLDDLSIDEDGISLSLDVAAAAIDTFQPPREPKVVAPIGPSADEVPRSRHLEVTIASGLLEPLSQLLVEADAAHINVRDLPELEFAALAEPAQMSEIVPDLKRFGARLELRSEFILTGPFRIEPRHDVRLPPTAHSSIGAGLHVPALTMLLSIRTSPTAEWTPYAELQIEVDQRALVDLQQPDPGRRMLQFAWDGNAEVHVRGHFIDAAHVSDQSIDVARVESILRAGWSAWTADAAQSAVVVPDVAVGSVGLRIEQLGWRESLIAAAFATPGTRITNLGPATLEYEARGPFSPWSEVERLPPGQTREYDVPYPLTFRRRDQRNEPQLTLPLGSHTEFEHGVPKSSD
jgi:hypothetical protein